MSSEGVYVGKVRTVKDIGYDHLLMTASNRLSSFDKHICNIDSKGVVLNYLSKWWFDNTSHIIDNHFCYAEGEHMIVRKAKTIKLEFVVRGYMTGSTETSIWPMYKSGKRDMYGINFREGYRKNEKLDSIILTPTTKGAKDHPITGEEIVSQGYLSQEQFDFIKAKSIELFTYGQVMADSRGLILVDTKYEFGFIDGKITLIDEIHTCDSSRYWLKESYSARMNEGLEPEKLDKDCIRDYVKSQCDPYNDDIPEIPMELKEKVGNVYKRYLDMFVNTDYDINMVDESVILERFFDSKIERQVVILAGSTSDSSHCKKIEECLKQKNIFSVIHYCSAHKNTRKLLEILDKYEIHHNRIIYVTVAGLSNALSGVVSCNTRFPVIACPPHQDNLDMMVNINSTLQCPSNVPVMTILKPGNVALAIYKIYRL